MKLAEKDRLTALTRNAVAQFSACCPPKVKERAAKVAARYSPTNAEQYRKLSEIAWWLIAVDCAQDARGLLDALCKVDDEYYWMFDALASAFATRAWLRAAHEPGAARQDARAALRWVGRDPNPRAITESEARGALERFDGWLGRAVGERGTVTALHVLSHALRVLVMYQQFAFAGDPAARSVPPGELTRRLESGVAELRRRIESW